jgi:hypothetical protein
MWWLPPSPVCGESYEFVFARGSSMHQKCSSYALTNLLFRLCRAMRIIDMLVTRLSPHLGALACPSTSKMLRTKECVPTPCPSNVFTFGFTIESIQEFRGMSLHEDLRTIFSLPMLVDPYVTFAMFSLCYA